MKIRLASKNDVKYIADIHTLSWQNTYNKVLTKQYLNEIAPKERSAVWIDRLENPKNNQLVIVAEHKDKMIGFGCIYSNENSQWGAYLDSLHISKSYQSKGIGKSLLLKIAKWCFKQEPAKGMCLLVNQDNVKAQTFYMKLGARNAKAGIWNAPDGSVVPTFWFVWDDLNRLIKFGKGISTE